MARPAVQEVRPEMRRPEPSLTRAILLSACVGAACETPPTVPDAGPPPVAEPTPSGDAKARAQVIELVAAMTHETDPQAKVGAALAYVAADPDRHPVLKEVLGPVLQDIESSVSKPHSNWP